MWRWGSELATFFRAFVGSVLAFRSVLAELTRRSVGILLLAGLAGGPVSCSFQVLCLPLECLHGIFR